jgi:RNA polymerase sigma-54 factor
MLRLAQEMKLAQKLDVRMIQSLKLLPLTTMQLEQRIQEELVQNPMLEEDENARLELEAERRREDEARSNNDDDSSDERNNDFTEAEWLKYLEDGSEYSSGARQEYDPNVQEIEPTYTYNASLSDHLTEQLGMVVRDDVSREIGEFIIGSINEDGFLELMPEEIAADLDLPAEKVSEVLVLIQTFDPPGVGAIDLRECLLIQLREKEEEGSAAWHIVADHFTNFTQRRFKDIMRALSIDEDELRSAMEIISTLDPRPGASIRDSANAAIIPDIIVDKVDGEYMVMLNDRSVPRLNINAGYRKLLERNSGTPKETRKYLVDKLNSARWFINSIEQRRTTILRVSTVIVERQRGFLEHGVTHLRPMTLQDVAEEVGVAISTVQRVTSGKYVQTPQGVFELKYFFTQRISATDGSEDLSAKTVKDRMSRLIQEEDSKKPLSDQKITDILNHEGISISRRAIAKYRDELQIPPARHRKQL